MDQLEADRALPIGEAVGHAGGHDVNLACLEGFVGTSADFEDYCARMRRNKWGDYLTLYAAAARCHARIKVWSSLPSWEEPKMFSPLDPTVPTDKELRLGHFHEFHYLSVED